MFGDLVRVHRRRLGLTQDELAGKSGLGVRSIRGIEAGRSMRPRPGTVRLLADALMLVGVDRERFYGAATGDLAHSSNVHPNDVHPSNAISAEGRPIPAQLPPDVPGFAGRDEQLRRLNAMAFESRTRPTVVISAIAGTAGVGKTALAVHWAHRARDRFPDGQLYVNLRGFDPSGSAKGPEEAVRGFLDALGVMPGQVPPDLAAQVGLYRSLMAGRRMLVVLDNAREPTQVRPLMPGTAGCLVVVTSRNELSGLVAADGARPMRLDLLSPGEARELLVRRLGPDRLAAEPDAVEEIIVRCGRLPLALAIVAARAVGRPDFPLAELAAQLRRAGLEALSGSDPTSDMRAVFGWSYRTLSGAAARLFRLLGLHPGPDISAPAAASLAGVSLSRVRSWLDELTRAHVITEHSPGRYALHDLLRSYATELAQAEDSASDRRAAVRRGVEHYLHTARAGRTVINPAPEPLRLGSPDPGVGPERLTAYDEAMAWFTAEHAVLLAVVDHAAAHGLHAHTWQLAWALATYLNRRGHWHDHVAIQNRALTSARRSDDRTGQAQAHWLLGSAYTKTERYEEAEFHFRKALELSVALDDRPGEAAGHWGVGYTLGIRGRYREALDHDLKSLDIYRTTDDRFALARALNAVGWDHAELGEHERAIEYCEEALAIITEIGGGVGQAATLNSLGNCHHRLGDHARAIERFRRALDIYRELGDRYYEADTLADLMDPLEAVGDIDAALSAGEDAVAILEELGHSEADRVRARLAALGRA